jgi:Mn2+/Fe2+ NRAMP family transporter
MTDAPAKFDPYSLPPDATVDPPTTLFRAMRQIGPGLILAASIVGTGELINTTALGAKAGFSLLWLILLSCVIKVFVQVELGRYAITHGKTSLAAFDTVPGPRLGASWICWLWLFMTLGTQFQIAAMEGTVGQVVHMAFPGASAALAQGAGKISPGLTTYFSSREEYIWAGFTALAAIALLLSGGYKRLERVTTILVGLVTAFTVLSVAILQWTSFKITVPEIESGFTFKLPALALPLAFSAFGITGVGASELIAYPYWCIEKGYARFAGPRTDDPAWAERARGWMKVMQLDAWFSMVVFTIATVAFYLLGAAVLNSQGLVPSGKEMIPTLSRMYLQPLIGTPMAGFRGLTRIGFLMGAWAVLFKTLYVATAANSRQTADFLNLTGIWRQATPDARERTVRAFCVIYPLLSVCLYYALREPGQLVVIGGTAQAMMLPIIAGATLYLRNRDTDKRVGPTFLTDCLTWLAFFIITVVALVVLHNQFMPTPPAKTEAASAVVPSENHSTAPPPIVVPEGKDTSRD